MGWFFKEAKVDYDDAFKKMYKEINDIIQRANNELDDDIRLSLFKLADNKYDDLLSLIDKGANFEKERFISMHSDLKEKIKLYEKL